MFAGHPTMNPSKNATLGWPVWLSAEDYMAQNLVASRMKEKAKHGET